MPVKQTIVKVTSTKRKRTKKNKSSNKRGNPNRCPTCGRFM